MAVSTLTSTGTKATTSVKLDAKVFNVEIKNHELVKQAYLAYQANGRENLAITKTRGLISGGGRKPWKQKGTGRARFGSSRNPIWRGGGIVFGPTGHENYTISINAKAKRLALRQALTLSANDDNLVVIEKLDFKSPKTADAYKLINKISADNTVLIVVDSISENLAKSTNNLPNVKVLKYSSLNVFDVLNADKILVTKDALALISTWLGDK